MAALVEGQQYGLSSQGNYSVKQDKSFIFVKLTDSALRAIEEYQKLRGNSSLHPSIQFQRNEGVITIPKPQASSPHSFSFSLSNVEAVDVPQGSFEILQQTGPRSLESLGCMIQKMQIHASEDIYEKTRVKISDVEKQSKQNCTKVIKASGPYVGRKVKVKTHLSKIPPAKTASSPPPASYSASTVKPIPKPLSTLNNGIHQASNNQVNSRASPVNKPVNQDIKRKSYRDRIIHLLALRSYKKPELLARLMRDGIKEKDKNALSAILCTVATTNRDNTYSLGRHCWSEVNEDWPFYTPEDREALKRLRLQNTMPPSGEGDHQSPASIHSCSSSPPAQQKRVLPGYESEQPSKKQRISHFVRQDANVPQHDSVGLYSAKSDAITGPRRETLGFPKGDWDGSFRTDYSGHRSPFLDSGAPPRTNGWSNGRTESTLDRLSPESNFLSKYHDKYVAHSKSNIYASDLLQRDRYAKNRPQVNNGRGSRGSTPQSSPDSRDSSDYREGSCSLTSSPSSPEAPAFSSKYGPITNGDQRARYKADFNAEYAEYRHHHSVIEEVSKRFAQLEDAFRNCKEGTDEWHRIKNEIVREYEDKKRMNFPDLRRRFQYLHRKLSHIKRLISDYDQSRLQAILS